MSDELLNSDDETPKPKRTRKPKADETPEADATPEEPAAEPTEPTEETPPTLGEMIAESAVIIGAVDEMETLRKENEELKATLAAERQKSHDLAEEVLDTMGRIDGAEKAVDEAEKELNAAKEVVKECKETFEDAVAHFRAVVKEAKQPLPLLGRKSMLSEQAKHLLGDSANGSTGGSATAVLEGPCDGAGLVVDENGFIDIAPPPTAKFLPPPDDDSWKRVPISIYELPTKLHEALEAAEIWTVGHLAAWTNAGKLLTDIPKVGEAKAKVIQDADLLFWERWSKGEITPPEAPAPKKPEDYTPFGDTPFSNFDQAKAENFEQLAEHARSLDDLPFIPPAPEQFEPPAAEFDPDSDSQSPDDGDAESL